MLRYGAAAPALWVQLEHLGYNLPEEDVAQLQNDADAITRLVIRGMLTKVEAKRARDRLHKRIGLEIENSQKD